MSTIAEIAPWVGTVVACVGWGITYGRQSQRLDDGTKNHDLLAAEFKKHREETIAITARAEGMMEARREHAAEVAERVGRLESAQGEMGKQFATLATVTSERSARTLDILREMEKLEETIDHVETNIIAKVSALDARVNDMGASVRSLGEWRTAQETRASRHSQRIEAIKGDVDDVERTTIERRSDPRDARGGGRYIGPDVSLGGDDRAPDDEPRKRR